VFELSEKAAEPENTKNDLKCKLMASVSKDTELEVQMKTTQEMLSTVRADLESRLNVSFAEKDTVANLLMAKE